MAYWQFTVPSSERLCISTVMSGLGARRSLLSGENGDADVVFVHDTKAEKAFVEAGFGVERKPVMYNDFVIVGPVSDPAGVKGQKDAVIALSRISEKGAPFVSRGDDSGTHKAELRLWKTAEVDVAAMKDWYRSTGSGMGPTLNMASAINAYTLTDRGTWLNFKNRGELEILVDGDERLFNPYGVILVNPKKHPHVKAAEG